MQLYMLFKQNQDVEVLKTSWGTQLLEGETFKRRPSKMEVQYCDYWNSLSSWLHGKIWTQRIYLVLTLAYAECFTSNISSNLDHLGPITTFPDHFRPPWASSDLIWPFQTILNPFGTSWTFLDSSDHFNDFRPNRKSLWLGFLNRPLDSEYQRSSVTFCCSNWWRETN